jgi:DNA adenine methylase
VKRKPSAKVPKTSTLANWYGSDRLVVDLVGALLAGCEWVGIPFAGGMGVVARLDARTIAVNDLHRHVINLGRVAGSRTLGPQLYRRLKRLPLHPDTLLVAQDQCRLRETHGDDPDTLFASGQPDPRFEPERADLQWAVDFAVCSWMGHGGRAGTGGEFDGGLSYRFTAGGGGSGVRYVSFVRSLLEWRRILREGRVEFNTLHWVRFLAKCRDEVGHGYYVDAPWPEAGDDYKHPFTFDDQRTLAMRLGGLRKSRVVVRFGDHPLIRELYPEGPFWTWIRQQGRNQANKPVDEVLILNPAAAAARSEAA